MRLKIFYRSGERGEIQDVRFIRFNKKGLQVGVKLEGLMIITDYKSFEVVAD